MVKLNNNHINPLVDWGHELTNGLSLTNHSSPLVDKKHMAETRTSWSPHFMAITT